MGANSYFENVWLEKVSNGLAQNNVHVQKSDSEIESTMTVSSDQVLRDQFGGIDYKYYATRSRTLRSDVVFSFIQIVKDRLKHH